MFRSLGPCRHEPMPKMLPPHPLLSFMHVHARIHMVLASSELTARISSLLPTYFKLTEKYAGFLFLQMRFHQLPAPTMQTTFTASACPSVGVQLMSQRVGLFLFVQLLCNSFGKAIKSSHPLSGKLQPRMYTKVTSVVSDSVRPYVLQPTRLLCPQDSPSKNSGIGCHVLLQGIFSAQGSNSSLLCLLHWQVGSL